MDTARPSFSFSHGTLMNMRITLAFFSICGLLAAASHSPQALGEDRPVDFFRALQDGGYPDIAVDYLKAMQADPAKMPAELKDIYDLEMCKALQAASRQAFNAKEAEAMTEEAKKFLDKFLKEKPNHPEAPTAQLSWGNMIEEKALASLRQGRIATDAEQKKAFMQAARDGLGQSRQRFMEAAKGFTARLDQLAKKPLSKQSTKAEKAAAAEHDRVELEQLNALFKIALSDYYLAQTYDDPKNAERRAALTKAAKRFDQIWHAYNVTSTMEINPIGLFAHMYDGKCREERDDKGDVQAAIDIYDEVLANVPEGQLGRAAANDPLIALFAQVEHFRLLLLKRKSKGVFINEAMAWIAKNKNMFGRTDGYQGLSIDLAKTLLAEAEKASDADKRKWMQAAVAILKEMRNIRSQYQSEAILVLRKAQGQDVKDVDPSQITSLDEAIAVADAALQDRKYASAKGAYTKALELAEKQTRKDPARIQAIYDHLAIAYLGEAEDLVNQNKLAEALQAAQTVAGEFVKKNKESGVGPRAASYAADIALSIYASAPADQKEAALEKLKRIAEVTISTWPGRPEADDARIKLGQAKQIVGNVDEAIKAFNEINPKSERYPVGQYMAGRLHWLRYRAAAKDPKADKEKAKDDRTKAMSLLEESLKGMQRIAAADTKKAPPKNLPDCQLLLAEAYLEGDNAKAAIPLLEPMVAQLKANKPEAFDNTTLRILLAATQAYLAVENTAKASEIGMMLLDMAPDMLQVNSLLIQIAKAMEGDKKNEAKIKQIVKKMTDRKQLGVGSMVYVGDACLAFGFEDEAEKQYSAIEARRATDMAFRAASEKAMPRINSQLAILLQRKGKYDEALRAVESLIKSHRNALEPYLVRARILEDRAFKTKEKPHFDAAVQAWASLRTMLESMKKPPAPGKMPTVPPEFYDCEYNLAHCMVAQAKALDERGLAPDREEAEKIRGSVRKLLSRTLLTNDTLNGPDTVEKYKKLLEELGAAPAKPAAKPADAKPEAKQ